ncbi:MAG: hypothetical protein ACYDER_27005 [Ktedonobacteraceae bacterium]
MRKATFQILQRSIVQPGRVSSKRKQTYKGVLLFSFLITVLALPLIFQGITSPPANAEALYSCGSRTSTNHCYAVQNWSGGVNGSRTHIFTNQLFPGDCFVTDEMWLGYQSGNTNYWVEAGEVANDAIGQGSELLFWADQRPGGGYTNHFGQYLSNSDFGKYSDIDIHRISSNQFSVSITGLPVASLSDTSKSNSMNPNLIGMGLEMCGSTGAIAPKNGYAYNQWESLSNAWSYQNNNGYPGIQTYPAYGHWTVDPQHSSTGGQWTTCIQGNGC